jgi:hypothetical protein
VKFDEKGQNILASVVVRLQNGKTYVPVWPKDVVMTMLTRASEGGSDQLHEPVPTKNDYGETPSDDGEKKGGCDGVFHRGPPIGKLSIASNETTAPRSNLLYAIATVRQIQHMPHGFRTTRRVARTQRRHQSTFGL